jgi:hypothetical protein
MLLRNSGKPKKQDLDTLFYLIDIMIREVLNERYIAEIDKQSWTKLINVVTMDIQVLKGNYDSGHIKWLIRQRIWQIEHTDAQRFERPFRDFRWQL